jgi:hypothetical protein
VALFKKKTKSSQDSGRMPLVLSFDENEPKAIAFGVSWRSVASRSSGRADAVKIARSGGATHLISTIQQFGYGLVPADVPADTKIYAAARVAARQHGGDQIYALKVYEGVYWFAVVRGGQPSSVDRVIEADNDMELLEAVREEIAGGLEDGITYNVFTNVEDHEIGDRVRGLTTQDLLLFAMGDEDVLLPLPKKSGRIPTPVIAVVGIAAVVGIGNKAWTMYQEKERQRLARLEMSAEESPEVAWARVTKAWAAAHRQADPKGLAAVRVSLGELPISWGGWDLVNANCSVSTAAPVAGAPVASASDAQRWICTAQYTRGATGRVNREMKELVPAGWLVQYRGLDTIIATWNVKQAALPFRYEALRPIDYHMVETISRLQRLNPAFSQVGDLTFVPVEYAAPRKKDGTVMPMPANVQQMRSASFTLKAPLRSIDALIDAGVDAEWQQINVYFKRADGEKVSITTSALTADIKGVIYAKQ